MTVDGGYVAQQHAYAASSRNSTFTAAGEVNLARCRAIQCTGELERCHMHGFDVPLDAG